MRKQALQQLPGVPSHYPLPARSFSDGGRPLPAGWRRPRIHTPGPRPRRVYLRCSAWRGPRGLVPVNVGRRPGYIAPPAAVVAPPLRGRAMQGAEVVAANRSQRLDRRGKYSGGLYPLDSHFTNPLTRSNVVTRVSTRLGSSLNDFIPSRRRDACAGTVPG